MRIKKITVIILTVFISRVIVSCCDCQIPIKYQYSYDYLSVYNLDHSGQFPVISQTNIIQKEAYGIQIDFSFTLISLNHNKVLTMFPEASAFDCFCPPETQYIAKDTISTIEITTINDFDRQHPADSDVSDLFKILSDKSYITFQNYINQLERVYEYTKPEKESLEIFLLQPPEFTGEHKFKIEIVLSDHRLLTMITNPAILE